MLAATYDRTVARFALLLALALPLSASAGTTSFQFFQTPSHNIGCVYSTSPQHLRCDIRTGLKPPPPKPKGCQNDWTFGYQLSGRGPARSVCAGDTVFGPGARILRYDQTWYRGPFNCTSLRTGLYCANHTLHGFWLSRARSYRYDGSPRAIRIRTPSGHIACEYQYLPPLGLRCDVDGGIKPLPPKPKSCEFDWGAGFFIGERGRASVVCTSGAINFPPQTTLRYGRTWRKLGGFSCTSRKSGLTCRNKSGHGFFLSKERSRRF
jgi:hypothetical protein